MNTNFSNDTLYCFYDFQVSPSSFDFFTFLYAAEICRIRRDLKFIYLTLVHGPNNKFRGDSLRSTEINEVFLHNVIIPGTAFLNSISAFCWIPRHDVSIKEIKKENLFPRGYEVKEPTSEYVAHELVASKIRDDQPGFLTAPKYAHELADDFIKSHVGTSHFVTLTTRELSRFDTNKTRSIKKDQWYEFLTEIKKKGVSPFVIRDTNKAFDGPLFDDIPEVNLASIHLPFRLALCERALLNFTKNSGPGALLWYSKSKCMNFFTFDNESLVVSEEWFKNNYGMADGDQFPMTTTDTEYSWNSENLDYILDAVEKKIETPHKVRTLNPFSNSLNVVYSCTLAIKHLIKNINYGVLVEDSLLIEKLITISKEYNMLSKENTSSVLKLRDQINHNLKI